MRVTIGADICPIGRNEALFASPGAALRGAAEAFQGSDLIIANLECPLSHEDTPITKCGPVLRAPCSASAGLAALGVDIFGLANNHIMDHGPSGLLSTLRELAKIGRKHVGAGRNLLEASAPLLLDSGSTRLAVLAFAEREFSCATVTDPGTCPLDASLVVRQLLAIPRDHFTIVLVHGGNEFFPYPNPWLRDMCHLMVELGANAVICQHSHCVGAYENFRGALIVYGQGNLLFDWPVARPVAREAWWRGVLVSLELDGARLASHEFIPIIQDSGGAGFRLADASEASAMLATIEQYSQVLLDGEAWEQEWLAHCKSLRRHYQNHLFGLSRPWSILNILTGLMGRRPRRARLIIGNVLRCEAHLQVLRTLYSIEATSGQSDGQ